MPTPTPTPVPTPTPTAQPLATIATPPPAPPASRPPSGPVAYDPAAHATTVVNLQIAAFALLSFGGAGGVAAAGMALRPAAEGEEHTKQGKGATTKVKQAGWTGKPGAGDRSATWRWPLTPRLDRVSAGIPGLLSPLSPLLARLLADGAHLRAMFGSASLLLPASGAVLGAVAVADTSGHALPPNLPLLAAICVLGALDSVAGVLAVLVFVAGVLALGGIATAGDARLMLGLTAIWCAVPVIANAARPLRRRPAKTLAERFDRCADFVVAALISAWAVQKVAAGLPGLAGHQVAVAAQANTLALIVLGAVLGRMVLEELTAWLYPQRLSTVLVSKVPGTGPVQRFAASAVRTVLMLVVAIAFVGSRWQLYAAAALFLLTQLAVAYEHSVGNFPRLYWWVPRGIVKATLLLLVGKWLGAVVERNVHDPRQMIADVFLLLTIPALAVAVFDLVGRDAPDPGWSWWERAAGTAVLVVGLLFALGIVGA